MKPDPNVPVHGTDGVHADTKTRDANFVMSGHHCHTCFELFYVESGCCRFLIDDSIQDLHAGDVILVPLMALHYTRYIFGTCRRTVILFRREDVLDEIRRSMPGGDRIFTETTVFQVPPAYRGQVAHCIKHMIAEEHLQDSRSFLMRKIYLQELLLLCARVCRFPRELPTDIHTTDQQILQAASFISEHYMQRITAQDIARAVNFSPNHLSRKFHQATGIGLHEYLVFIRLQHAAQELITTDDSITTIALRCGFSDGNYFKDSFKKKFGVTPRTYRQMK